VAFQISLLTIALCLQVLCALEVFVSGLLQLRGNPCLARIV